MRMAKFGLLMAWLLAISVPARAWTVLSNGHVDGISIGYHDGHLELHVHDDETDTEYEPDDVIFLVPPSVQYTVPSNPPFSFLGNPGDPIWILPQVQIPDVLFLGSSAHEVPGGVFTGVLNVTLTGLSGPGHFALYQTGGFGIPTVFMNTRDGIDSSDQYQILVGGHMHFNWAFSAEGLYGLTVKASGTRQSDGSTVESEPTTYHFWVGDPALIPEPGTAALVALGLAGALGGRRGSV
ncbi:MAG: choice-of-anchor M domain-containing protein [Verrucomicrobiae bacterium]|nr:choice-of-anchor M domain-containing protein [Verrucomicrobiae bacterium]